MAQIRILTKKGNVSANQAPMTRFDQRRGKPLIAPISSRIHTQLTATNPLVASRWFARRCGKCTAFIPRSAAFLSAWVLRVIGAWFGQHPCRPLVCGSGIQGPQSGLHAPRNAVCSAITLRHRSGHFVKLAALRAREW